MERPFTGKYWWVKDMGTYSWKMCTQKLFNTEHKYQPNNGYANFWSHILDSVSYRDDHLENHQSKSITGYVKKEFRNEPVEMRAVWSNCESHLGFVYGDGPGPFHKRFTINSAAVEFTPKPFFEEPRFTTEEKMMLRKYDAEMEYVSQQREQLLKDEELMGIEPDTPWISERQFKPKELRNE